MRKINLNAVTENELKSPKGKYHHHTKDVSVALGRDSRSLDLLKRHPFDLAVTRIPPGATRCPYHARSAQWELYVVIAGAGKVRHDQGVTEVSIGDVFLFGPNEAHQIINESKEDFVYYVIADNPIGATCYYPDSRKWAVAQPSERIILKGNETEYWDGEE
ncbi:MAG TPA: cupin domain-containing protein [Verrucomicrobiae bacterium]|jgi:uncharacterized cupin superfamily protein|nr:cupin domain-containing protein [Verrucomicrobiae bacterium]